MRWFDVDGNQIKDWQVGDEIPDNADAMVDLKMGGVIWGGGFDIPLDIDVPFFSLDVDGGFAFELGWSFDFGFGLSVRDGVYLATNEDAQSGIGTDCRSISRRRSRRSLCHHAVQGRRQIAVL